MASDEHPYSLAYEVNGLVYVSGAVGVDEEGNAPTDARPALDAALAAVRRRLEAVGLGLDNVAKATYFVRDIRMRKEANEQFVDEFSEPRPARTFVEVAKLPYDAQVVIEAIAHR